MGLSRGGGFFSLLLNSIQSLVLIPFYFFRFLNVTLLVSRPIQNLQQTGQKSCTQVVAKSAREALHRVQFNYKMEEVFSYAMKIMSLQLILQDNTQMFELL